MATLPESHLRRVIAARVQRVHEREVDQVRRRHRSGRPVQLPDIDGSAVVERLMHGPKPHPAVVLISTRTASSYRQRLAASPALG